VKQVDKGACIDNQESRQREGRGCLNFWVLKNKVAAAAIAAAAASKSVNSA
jgi:predicted HicB family RNase H-like nuclease